jgi:hypothetical protein
LVKLQIQIQLCLEKIELPLWKEFGIASWHITKALLGFIPIVGDILDGKEVINSIQSNKGVFNESISFFRGQARRKK